MIFAERRKAFLDRIYKVIADNKRATGAPMSHAQRFDIVDRLHSAMEDAYLMGLREFDRKANPLAEAPSDSV